MEKDGRAKWSVFGIYILATAVCLAFSVPVFSHSIVLDEAYSIVFARGNLADIVRATAADVHPPLYYFLLWFVRVLFGESIVKYRIITALAAYLNLFWLGATLIRRKWGDGTAVFYILWFGLTYCTFEKSMIIRMYPLGCLLVTAVVIYLFSLYENWQKKDYILSILLTIAAMYTHYFAVMAVFAAWVILFAAVYLKKRQRVWQVLGGGVLIALGYLPWMGVVLSQTRKVTEGYWIPSFNWGNWFKAPALLMESSLTGCGYALHVLVFALLFMACLRRNRDALIAGLVFACTMLIGALLSVCVAPIWEERYLYVAWGVLALAMALVLGQRSSAFSWVSQGLAVLLFSVVGAFSFGTMYQSGLNTDTAREWTEFLEVYVEAGDLIIADDDREHILVYQAYLPDNQVVLLREVADMDDSKAALLFADAAERPVWYAVNYVMQAEGVSVMEDVCERYGLSMQSAGRFTIQAKDIEVFRVQGK